MLIVFFGRRFSAAMRSLSILRALILAVLLPALANSSDAADFGKVHFPITCSAEAQESFDRALAMLHSFFYPQTLVAFEELATKEPSCAMAHWGIAISQRPNPLVGPFSQEILQRGYAAIEKARAASRQSPREREWIEALATFFEGYSAIAQGERTANYEKAMARLYANYPTDPEAGIFYALSLNEAVDIKDKTYRRQLKAAAILEALEPMYPAHPGILHYLLHSYDYPGLAERGLFAAARCSQLAPAAPHALHMPSHIFSTLGMWDSVIASDRAADALTVSYGRKFHSFLRYDPETDPARFHSLDFLVNAHLQLSQDKQAKEIVDLRNGMSRFPDAFRYSGHTAFAAIPVRYAFERHAWAEAAALKVASTPYPQAEAVAWFGRAIGGARSDKIDLAEQSLRELKRLKAKLQRTGDAYWVGQVDVQERASAAWIAWRAGRVEEALTGMSEAADLEDGSIKHVAMENRLSPMRELLAELMLEVDRPGAALEQFERSLRTYPNRYRSLAGAANAAELSKNERKKREYFEKLIELTAGTDTDRPDVIKARRFLGR